MGRVNRQTLKSICCRCRSSSQGGRYFNVPSIGARLSELAAHTRHSVVEARLGVGRSLSPKPFHGPFGNFLGDAIWIKVASWSEANVRSSSAAVWRSTCSLITDLKGRSRRAICGTEYSIMPLAVLSFPSQLPSR